MSNVSKPVTLKHSTDDGVNTFYADTKSDDVTFVLSGIIYGKGKLETELSICYKRNMSGCEITLRDIEDLKQLSFLLRSVIDHHCNT